MSAPWYRGPLMAFDFETTGVDAHTCRVVQAGLATIDPVKGATQHLWLLDPGVDIPDGAAAVHGITTERARAEGKQPAEVLRDIGDTITAWLTRGLPLIAMNAAYDCTLLEAELTRHGLPTVTERVGAFRPVVDPFVLDKQVDPYRKGKRRLENLCEHYKVRLDGAHDAGHDAMAAARVAWKIASLHPRIAGMKLQALHDEQVEWAASQADSLRAYFDRNGTAHDGVDGTWPVRRTPTAVPA